MDTNATNDKPSVSVICCYTSTDKLAYLADSLNAQNMPCERIFVDNSANRFSSAAAALNYGAQKATGELLLFCHQDIRFKDEAALADLVDACTALNAGDVGGIAGAICVDGKKVTKTNITHSMQEIRYAEKDWFDSVFFEVDSVDECLIILRKTTWQQYPFNEEVCDGWHFYGVELCLRARSNGHRALAFDARINHISSEGTLDKSFFRALYRLARAYRSQYDVIVATTGCWSTKHPHANRAAWSFDGFLSKVFAVANKILRR